MIQINIIVENSKYTYIAIVNIDRSVKYPLCVVLLLKLENLNLLKLLDKEISYKNIRKSLFFNNLLLTEFCNM